MMANQTGMRVVGVVENMTGEVFGTAAASRSPTSSACRCSAASRSTRGCAARATRAAPTSTAAAIGAIADTIGRESSRRLHGTLPLSS